jgi:hypothetical protein
VRLQDAASFIASEETLLEQTPSEQKCERLPLTGRSCCKTLFAPGLDNLAGRRCDFLIGMRGTSSQRDELTGDLRNEPEVISMSGLDLLSLLAGKFSPDVFGLLQHNLG